MGNYPHGSLPHHLNQRKQLETWFDLEQELFKYAHESNTQLNISNLEVDQKAFEDIHNAFSDYLKNQVECFEPSSRQVASLSITQLPKLCSVLDSSTYVV